MANDNRDSFCRINGMLQSKCRTTTSNTLIRRERQDRYLSSIHAMLNALLLNPATWQQTLESRKGLSLYQQHSGVSVINLWSIL